MKKDILVRGTAANGMVKFSGVQAAGVVQRAREIHNSMPLATAALGRTLIAASIMGDEIKDEKGSVTLQIRGNGPLGGITAVSDAQGNVRGYAQNPGAILPLKEGGKLDVGRGVGRGLLTVIKDVGKGEPFSGKIELQSGEIGEDIAAYYATSEQIPTVVALGVLVDRDYSVKCAGGFVLQLLPSAPEGLAHILEERIRESQSLTTLLDSGMSMEEILTDLMDGMNVQILEQHEIAYQCKCSAEKVHQVVAGLNNHDLDEILSKDSKVEITCQFCDKNYQIERQFLEKIRNERRPVTE